MNVVLKRIRGLASGKLHHYALQKLFRDQRAREWIANQVAKARPRLAPNQLSSSERSDANRLAHDGYVDLDGIITVQQIADIKDYLQGKLCYDRNRPQQVARFLPHAAPVGTHIAAYTDADTVHCPHVLQLANNQHILKVVGSYFNCQPTISNLSIWWSLATDDKPEEAENFHRDMDDWRQLKLFIYLTDVTAGLGPHVFVKESHRIRRALKIKRYSDEEIVDIFDEQRIVTFFGPAGTCFLENTFGLHKGTTARTGNRLLLQVLYSLNPLGVSDYQPVSQQPAAERFDGYVNRLYVR